MSNITELKVNLSKYTNPDSNHSGKSDDDYNIRPLGPDIPDTGNNINTGDHGFFTVSNNTSRTSQTNSNLSTVTFVSFLSFALILLFGLLLPKVVRKIRSRDSERYDLKRSRFSHSSRLSFYSTVFASLSLLVSLVSTVAAYHLPTILSTKASDTLTIDADIIGTDAAAYVHDTITIPASNYGYNIYLSTDGSEDNRLIGDSTNDVISSISQDGSLANNSYGYTFDNPASSNAIFHPVQKKSERTAVLSLSPEKTKTEQHIDIWYGVRAKNLDESVYRTNIEYTAIGEHDLTLEEMTPEICASLEEGILDYTFKSSIDQKDYNVYKLKDGNCWTKEIPSAPTDPKNPDATISTICPTNWHQAILSTEPSILDNYDILNLFYDVNNPDTKTDVRIVNLKENSCIANYAKTTFTFDLNDGPDTITMPNPETISSVNFKTEYTLPSIPNAPLSEHFRGWSLNPDNDEPSYQPGDTVTFTSPEAIIYAIWDEKIPKAILDEDGLLNFVYDYYTIDEVINNVNGYRTAYESARAPIKTEGTNCERACVYEVPENATDIFMIPWNNHPASVQNYNRDIITVNFEDTFKNYKPKSTSYWFTYLLQLRELTDLDNLNTSMTANMAYMFSRATHLTSITFPEGFGSQATTMNRMFMQSGIEFLILPKDFGEKAENMDRMFWGASSLKRIYVPKGTNWATKKVAVESSTYIFQRNVNLPNYDDSSTDVTRAHIGEVDDVLGYFTDVCEYYGTCEEDTASTGSASTSGTSASPSYSPQSFTPSPVEPDSTDTTEPETVTVPSAEDEQTEPYGVFQRTATDKTDYALIIVTIISIALILLGALIIFLIEKRERDEDDDIEEY